MLDLVNFEQLQALRDDPILFAEVVLGMVPPEIPMFSDDQKWIAAEIARPGARVAVHSCHGSGKTFFAGRVVLPWFLIAHAPCIVVTTAASGRTVSGQLWEECRSAVNAAPYPLGGDLKPKSPEWHFAGDTSGRKAADRKLAAIRHFAIGFSTDDINKIRGYHHAKLLVIVDESAGVAGEIWTGIDGLITGSDNRVLILGNPGDPSGPYYDRCKKKRFGYRTRKIGARTQPNVVAGKEIIPGGITRQWVAEKRRQWGPDSPLYQMLVDGDFPDQGINSLIGKDWVDRAVDREPIGGGDEPMVITADIAYEGTDETVIMVIVRDAVEHMEAFSGRDTDETAARIMRLYRYYKGDEGGRRKDVRVVIDDIGLGHAVTVELRKQKVPVACFKGSLKPWYQGQKSKTPDKRSVAFKNLRSQAWWHLREVFRAEKLTIPDDDQLVSQLLSMLYEPEADGTILVESKKEAKKRGVSSPDRADALMMGVWLLSKPRWGSAFDAKRRRDMLRRTTAARAGKILGGGGKMPI